MNKDKFDYYWKIALILVLVLGMIYMFWEFKTINQKGISCAKQPFIYGAQVMSSKYGDDGFMDCSCTVGNSEQTKSYSFNQNQENPHKNIGIIADFSQWNFSN